MSKHDDATRAFARRLRRAELDGTAVPLASETFANLDWQQARQIAIERDRLRVDDGDIRIGYKLGWTSIAMREALGIDRPNWGTLWRSQRTDGHLGLATLRHAKVEPEIVYVAGRELRGAGVDAASVVEHASGWAIGIEVVHPRWASFDFTWLDNTADNSSAAAVLLGPVRQLRSEPAALEIEFSNGSESRRGLGEQAMGSPAEAVAWLTRQLATEDRSIEPGDVIFTGGLTAPFDVTAGSSYAATCPELGTVETIPTTTH